MTHASVNFDDTVFNYLKNIVFFFYFLKSSRQRRYSTLDNTFDLIRYIAVVCYYSEENFEI